MKRIIFIAALCIFIASPAAAYIVDEVEAVVNGTVITKSEVDKAYEVEALKDKEAGRKPSPGLRQQVLKTLVDRTLLLDEARKFGTGQVTDEDVNKAYEKVKAGFPGEAAFMDALKKEEITPEELKENLRGQLLSANFVENRIKFFVRVTIEDEKEFYEKNKDKFNGRPFVDVQEEIHNLLIEKDTNLKLDEYLKELKSKAKITYPGRAKENPVE